MRLTTRDWRHKLCCLQSSISSLDMQMRLTTRDWRHKLCCLQSSISSLNNQMRLTTRGWRHKLCCLQSSISSLDNQMRLTTRDWRHKLFCLQASIRRFLILKCLTRLQLVMQMVDDLGRQRVVKLFINLTRWMRTVHALRLLLPT